MKAFFATAFVLMAVPALAADVQPATSQPSATKPAAAQPSTAQPASATPTNSAARIAPQLAAPPPVSYTVWGMQWKGRQFVQDAGHSFTTTDLREAQTYADQVNSYAGWTATTNIPEAAVVHATFRDRRIPRDGVPQPSPATFDVWAYKSVGGNWVKDNQYSWSTSDPQLASDYAATVAAVAGWRTSTNAPAIVPEAQRYVDGGPMHGVEQFAQTIRLPRFRISINGRTIDLSSITVPYVASEPGDSSDSSSSSFDYIDNTSPPTDNTAWIQDMINNQNMINNINQQNAIQDMINTQNAVNTQQMIDNQNMINAMNNANNP